MLQNWWPFVSALREIKWTGVRERKENILWQPLGRIGSKLTTEGQEWVTSYDQKSSFINGSNESWVKIHLLWESWFCSLPFTCRHLSILKMHKVYRIYISYPHIVYLWVVRTPMCYYLCITIHMSLSLLLSGLTSQPAATPQIAVVLPSWQLSLTNR